MVNTPQGSMRILHCAHNFRSYCKCVSPKRSQSSLYWCDITNILKTCFNHCIKIEMVLIKIWFLRSTFRLFSSYRIWSPCVVALDRYTIAVLTSSLFSQNCEFASSFIPIPQAASWTWKEKASVGVSIARHVTSRRSRESLDASRDILLERLTSSLDLMTAFPSWKGAITFLVITLSIHSCPYCREKLRIIKQILFNSARLCDLALYNTETRTYNLKTDAARVLSNDFREV